MIIRASAPSNIALIKYMGKTDAGANRPTNSSLSFTLENLRTFVQITPIQSGPDQWELLTGQGLLPFELSEKGRDRFLKHFSFLKTELGIQGFHLVRSASNFPSDCGLASSASSFAALTLATAKLAEESAGTSDSVQYQSSTMLYGSKKTIVTTGEAPEMDSEAKDLFALADLSRRGSGSSCRSFFGPWVLWEAEGVRPLEFPMGPLDHVVVVVEGSQKAVSSSEAHRRVPTSLLFKSRPQRAEERLASLLEAFRRQDWAGAFEITWAEFWDMHALFETSKPSFGYFQPGTLQVLADLRSLWTQTKDGPLVTMDAGANVHLLFRPEQKSMREKLVQYWEPKLTCYTSVGDAKA